MPSKVLNAFWFSGEECIGIVVVQDEITKEKKAYIGVGSGTDPIVDTGYIMKRGYPVNLSQLKEIVALMEKKGE